MREARQDGRAGGQKGTGFSMQKEAEEAGGVGVMAAALENGDDGSGDGGYRYCLWGSVPKGEPGKLEATGAAKLPGRDH